MHVAPGCRVPSIFAVFFSVSMSSCSILKSTELTGLFDLVMCWALVRTFLPHPSLSHRSFPPVSVPTPPHRYLFPQNWLWHVSRTPQTCLVLTCCHDRSDKCFYRIAREQTNNRQGVSFWCTLVGCQCGELEKEHPRCKYKCVFILNCVPRGPIHL